jgi:parvulin-like peptidyl-prolyl isomerase
MLVLAMAAVVTAVAAQQPPPAPRFDTAMTPPPPTSPPPTSPPLGVAMPGHAGSPAVYPSMARAPHTVAYETPRRLPPAAQPPNQSQALPPTEMASPATAPPALPDKKLFELGKIIAWVGDLPIQNGDIMPMIEQMVAPALEKMSPEERRSQQNQIDEQKGRLLQQLLTNSIETKLLYLDFLRSLPEEKRKEVLPTITKRAEEQFYEKQLPDVLKRSELSSAIEWDAELRKYGSSLAAQRQMFVERILGQSMLGQKIDYEPEVTHQEMLDYYRENADDYEIAARARWEKLTVRFERYPNRAQAWAALAEMGNEILRGAPLEAVARRSSQDVDAPQGGYHDWTTYGSLASDELNQAIFSLPVGKLSERVEDGRGFHIVRVIEREEAGQVPFLEAQVEIKEAIRKDKIRQQINEYVTKLRDEIPVWTIFDDPSDSP